MHDSNRRPRRRPWPALLLLPTAACTDMMLTGYRDPQLLIEHRYAHGENYTHINGIRVCYQTEGTGEPVLILPGVGTSIDFWQLNLPTLADRFQVLALDPPGFGKSEKPDASYDLLWICDQVLAFLDERSIERVNIIGGSFGGHIGLLLALNHPERVDKLVMMGSVGAWPPPGILADGALKLFWNDCVVTDHLRRLWPGIFRRMFIRQTDLTRSLLRYQMARRASISTYGREGLAASRALRSIFYNSCRDRLPDVTVPVLLVWGEHDGIHPIEDGQYMADHIPGARLDIIPDAGHEAMIDQPGLFNRVVTEFFQAE